MSVDHAKKLLRDTVGAKGNERRPERGTRVVRARGHSRAVTSWWRSALLDAMLLAACAVLLALPSFTWPLESADESILLVYAEQVRDGLVPHRDFFTVYGPAPFYLLASVFSVFGSSVLAERVLGLALHVGVALGCYLIGRSRDRATGVQAGLLSVVLMFPLGAVAYAWLGAMACVTCALGVVANCGRRADPVVGALLALAACFRPEMVVLVLVVTLCRCWGTGDWSGMTAGALFGLAPLVALVTVAGDRLWRNIVIGRIGINGSLDLMTNPARSGALISLVVLLTGGIIWSAWRQSSRQSVLFAAVAVLLTPQAFQRIDPEHALYVALVTAPLLLVMAGDSRSGPERARSRRLTTATMVVAVVGGLVAMLGRPSSPTTLVQVAGRSAVLDVADAADLAVTRAALLRFAPPNGRIFVGSIDMSRASLARTAVYYLVPELKTHGYYLELAVGVSERAGSGLVEDVRSADVLLLSPMPEDLRLRLFPFVPAGSDEANEVVAREFCKVAETGWGEIYQHRPCAGGSGDVHIMTP